MNDIITYNLNSGDYVFVDSSLTMDIDKSLDIYYSELKKDIEILKRRTDINYAKKCVIEELLAEYRKLVLTEQWFEATKAWVNHRIDEIIISYTKEFDRLFGIVLFGTAGIRYADDYISSFSDRTLVNKDFMNKDIILKFGDKRVSVKDLLNENPEVEGYEFEKFVISYCKK